MPRILPSGTNMLHHHRSKKPAALADLVEPASLLVADAIVQEHRPRGGFGLAEKLRFEVSTLPKAELEAPHFERHSRQRRCAA
jgi:hypothetical protein